MSSGCFKRYRMEFDLSIVDDAAVAPPRGYFFIPWHEDLLQAHAQVKWESFRHEIDSVVFPCLGTFDGCHHLMGEIADRHGFQPAATWLALYHPNPLQQLPEYCGTIQGISTRSGHGSIQNVGVTPGHRQMGIGRGLISRALQGFREAGLSKAYLEVTAQNDRAVALYRRLGFRVVRTLYKSVDVPAMV